MWAVKFSPAGSLAGMESWQPEGVCRQDPHPENSTRNGLVGNMAPGKTLGKSPRCTWKVRLSLERFLVVSIALLFQKFLSFLFLAEAKAILVTLVRLVRVVCASKAKQAYRQPY